MGLIFGKNAERNPKEMVNEWCHKLRKTGYNLERQLRAIKREEQKMKLALKKAHDRGDIDACAILVKNIARSQEAISKIHTSKAHVISLQMQLKNQLAVSRMMGSLQKSAEVMQAMQALVRLPEVAHTMQELSKEMMRAGIIEEMLDETMASSQDEEESKSEPKKIFKAMQDKNCLPGAVQIKEGKKDYASLAEVIAELLKETTFNAEDVAESEDEAQVEVDKAYTKKDVSKIPWILKFFFYGISYIYYNISRFVFGS